jgi:hypothetical protein
VIKPFTRTLLAERTRPRSPIEDVAQSFYDQHAQLGADASILRALIGVVDSVHNLAPPQWAHWYGITLGFQPDLIIELGRGHGNSTALFCLAGERLRDVEIVSICLTSDWTLEVAAKVAGVIGRSALSRLDARIADIGLVDYERIVSRHRRVLLLWDAHGFEIAEVVFGQILPAIADREHLVLMHDISDNRYLVDSPAYTGGVWRPRPWPSTSPVNIGWMQSIVEQVIPLADFSVRNDLEIGSGEHEFRQFFEDRADRSETMQRALGTDLFSLEARWAFFSLSGKPGPWHFPTVPSRLTRSNRADVVPAPPARLPIRIDVEPSPWNYAASFTWTCTADVPPEHPVFMRVRVSVEGGTIGVGLVDSRGSRFLDRRAVAPGRSMDVLFPIPDMTLPKELIVQCWALPESSRVTIESWQLEW